MEALTPEQRAHFEEHLRILVTAFVNTMHRMGIENYLEITAVHPDLKRKVVVTMRWLDGLTPVQKYEKHLSELREELAKVEQERDQLLQEIEELRRVR